MSPNDVFESLQRQPQYQLYAAVSSMQETLAHAQFPKVLPASFQLTTSHFWLLPDEEYRRRQVERVRRTFHPSLPRPLVQRNADWVAASHVAYDPDSQRILVKESFFAGAHETDPRYRFLPIPVLGKELAHLVGRVFEQRIIDPAERRSVGESLRHLGIADRTADQVVIKRWGMARDYYLDGYFLGQDAKVFFLQDLYADSFGQTVFVFATMLNFDQAFPEAVEYVLHGHEQTATAKSQYIARFYRYVLEVGLEALLAAGVAGDESQFQALGAQRYGERPNQLRLAELAVLRDQAVGRNRWDYTLG